VLAVLLAVRAWQTLLVPLIATNLASGDVLRQAVGVVVLTLVAVPLALGVSTLLVRSAAPVRFWLEELSGRAARHRHREALAALRAVPVWSELPPGGLLELARALRARSVAPGEEVVRQGDEGDGFYLIDQGAFEVLVNGEPQVRLGRGDFFGERALLERVRRAASVIAIEPGRVFVLARRDFDALLASDIAFRSRVQAALAYRDELRDMPLFHDLAPREVDALVARLVPRSVRCGETIIRQGEVGDRFYVIRSGRLRVERDGVVLTDLGPGEAFGEIALLFDVPRTATVVAVEDARLLGLDAQDFRDVLAGYLGRARDLERLSHLRLSTHRRLDEVVK
jgi:CRP-like cAMP-binding protein